VVTYYLSLNLRGARRMRNVLLALILVGSSLGAQQTPLIGEWKITYPGEIRMQDGVVEAIMVTGKLVVRSEGDSLIATLATEPSPQLPARPTLRLATKVGTGDAVFVSRSRATLNINGEERQATSVSTWTLKATGDVLEGSVERRLEGMESPGPGPHPIKGTRLK
jgi:hypothetical protein